MKRIIPISTNPDVNWRNNDIQFPRLIAEMEAAGIFAQPGVLVNLAKEMDLTVDDICFLIDRAQQTWDSIKGEMFDDGTSGQDRESYSDTQDRKSYRPST
jgi:hypothetical protein